MACVPLTFMARAEVTGPSSRNVLKHMFKCTIIMHILKICPASFSQALGATKPVVKIKKSAGLWIDTGHRTRWVMSRQRIWSFNIFSFLNLGAM